MAAAAMAATGSTGNKSNSIKLKASPPSSHASSKNSLDTFDHYEQQNHSDITSMSISTPSSSPSQQRAARPSNARVQSALVIAQICFGLGGVISALGLPACNPFAFALYREIIAGSILLVASSWPSLTGETTTTSAAASSPSIMREWKRFTLLGLSLFGNQAGVIAGIKLAGPVAAAVWQPSQPIMTAAICMILGWEPPAIRRILGVIISFAGCAVMVILSTKKDRDDDAAGAGDDHGGKGPSRRMLEDLVGHCLFFFNCLCTSLYVLLSKKTLLVYPPMKVTAWSYNIAAAFMVTLACVSSLSERAMDFLCPDCTGTWTIPRGAVLALAYAIIFNSVIAYALITWSNQYATGTLVIGYSVLQPVTAALFTLILLGIGMFPSCSSIADTEQGVACLDPPGWSSVLGMIGVFSGLALVIMTEPTKEGGERFKYQQVAKEKDVDRPTTDLELT